jgi:YidC/Oxa1 family membrane protein insertase
VQGLLDSLGQLLGPIGTVFKVIFYQPVYNVLMVIYEGLSHVIPGGSLALAIIILTLIIRAALIPLTRKQLSSTRKMQMIQPQLKALQQQYRGDPQTLMAEQRKLYKENGVSMYGGCLPLLVQMPFLYALYDSMFTLIGNNPDKILGDLYPFVPHVSLPLPQSQIWFVWTSLAVPDTLHILPIIAALLTFAQMRMALPVRKKRQPGENPDPTSQAMGTTQYIMPLVTLFFGWTFPAGLALYWCVSTAFSAVQQYFINGNFGSLFVGVPGMEHLVPEPKDLTPTTTRQPVVASRGAASAVVAESPPMEGGLRGWWNRMKESATAAQSQAMERAEQARQEREEAAEQARQQAAERDGTTGRSAPARRQRPTRQGPVLLRPPQSSGAGDSAASEGDAVDEAIQQATDTSTPPEKAIVNGTSGTNGSTDKAVKPSSNGANGVNGSAKSGGASGARNTGNNGTSGTKPATGGSNAARKNSPKGGSGGRSGSGRPKRR